MLLESQITLTWYPGVPGDTADPLVLLSSSHYVPDPSGLSGDIEQLVQRADYVRGTGADFFPRGNNATRLTWEEVRRYTDPMEAQEVAMTLAAGLPAVSGWMSIAFATRDTTWKVSPAVVKSLGWSHDDKKGWLRLRWSVDCGALSILAEGEEPPTIYAPGEVIAGTAVNRGAILLGPNRTYPAV